MQHDDERPRPQEQPEKTPDTPTDEPKPAPVQDPPAEPDRGSLRRRGPRAGRGTVRVETMNDAATVE